MLPSQLLGLLSGIASALVWGTGDFVGGLAARRSTQFQVVALSALSAVCLLVPAAILAGEPVPTIQTVAWSLAAGVCGAVGIAALYQGLSTGSAAIVAPTSAVVGAALPLLAAVVLQSLPTPFDFAGILAGLAGIWLVSSLGMERHGSDRAGLLLGLLAGAGFGGFFVLIAQVEAGTLFSPVALAKLAAFAFGTLMLVVRRQGFPFWRHNPLALLAGVLDTGGNLLFLLAARATGLAVAAVLASMYPAATVAWSMVFLQEKVTRRQIAGVILCVGAVALISL